MICQVKSWPEGQPQTPLGANMHLGLEGNLPENGGVATGLSVWLKKIVGPKKRNPGEWKARPAVPWRFNLSHTRLGPARGNRPLTPLVGRFGSPTESDYGKRGALI